MKNTFSLSCPSLLCAFALLFAGCGSSPASIMDDMISEMNAMTEILEGIESQEDFDSVKDDLESHAKTIQELGKQLEAMKDDLSAEEMKEIEEYLPKIMQASFKMAGAAMKAAAFGFDMQMPSIN